jgi:N-acyl-D-aspartate/D-glutamate deacylase
MLTKGSRTSIEFLESLAAGSGRPVLIAALFHNSVEPDQVFEETAQIDAARARGHPLHAQVSCCPLTMDFTLHSPYVFEGIEAWQPAMKVHGDGAREVYRDAAFRGQVKSALDALRGKRLFNSEWDKVHVVEVANDEHRALEGKNVAELAERDGKHPLDWLLDLSLSENLDTLFTAQLRNSDVEGVARLISDPNTHVSLSDAGAHLTFLCDAGFGLHLLGYWARDVGAISLAQAVRKLTGHPASLFGIADRGVLRAGAFADLLLFDPATVGRGPNRRTFDLPAGAPRLRAEARGVLGVWVNGRRIVDRHGLRADAPRNGRLLRDFVA